MFERFTDRARRTLVLAQHESMEMGHNYIGTEHLLLGIAAEGEGVAHVALRSRGIVADDIRAEIQRRVESAWKQTLPAAALATVGIDLDKVREQVDSTFGPGSLRVSQPPFTPLAKKVLQQSVTAAKDLGHDYIGTEHLLLGLCALEEGMAGDIVVSLGSTSDDLRDTVLGILKAFTHVSAEPVWADTAAMMHAVRLLPEEHRARANEVLRDVIYPAQGRMFIAVAAAPDDDLDHVIAAQMTAVAAANHDVRRRFDDLGVASFIDVATRLRAHPAKAAITKHETAVRGVTHALMAADVPPARLAAAVRVQKQVWSASADAWKRVWDEHADASDDDLASILVSAAADIAETVAAFLADSLAASVEPAAEPEPDGD